MKDWRAGSGFPLRPLTAIPAAGLYPLGAGDADKSCIEYTQRGDRGSVKSMGWEIIFLAHISSLSTSPRLDTT